MTRVKSNPEDGLHSPEIPSKEACAEGCQLRIVRRSGRGRETGIARETSFDARGKASLPPRLQTTAIVDVDALLYGNACPLPN